MDPARHRESDIGPGWPNLRPDRALGPVHESRIGFYYSTMSSQNTAITALDGLTSAFAMACRQARTEGELLERCRRILADRLGTDEVWLTVTGSDHAVTPVGPQAQTEAPVELVRHTSGDTTLVISTTAATANGFRSVAFQLGFGLALLMDLRSVLVERQRALDDAVFQLRALRQVARLLSSAHSTEDTEHLVLDFMAEVFFAWWACLYRPSGGTFVPRSARSLDRERVPDSLSRERLEALMPIGSGVTDQGEVELAALLPKGTELVVPFDASGERVGVLLLGPRLNGLPYARAERDLATTLAFAGAIALKNSELVERLQSAATTDQLTGLFNRRALEERLEAEISRSVRHQIRTTLVMVDLDRFKAINDSLGHAAGDRYLVLVSQLLRRQVRTLDVVGRLGGDEFLVVLPMTNPAEATGFIQRVQDGFRDLLREYPEFGIGSLSIGMAEAPRDGLTPAAVMAAADAALYAAKREGGNTVKTAGSQ
ncbi:MAG: GGDEF domain-containing protein [Gemmatimonadetes bacterium]|nr:GGDEF domain-containing protein [Gemmatimonadota bacterium]